MNINNTHPKIETCVRHMFIDTKYDLPFYAEYNLMINFKGTDSIPTCGVNVSRTGMNFYYNTEFLDNLPQEEVNFIDIHEIFHLLFNHPKRTVSGRYDPKLANIAQDMIINSIIWSDINRRFVQIPKDEKGKNMALFLPKDYDGKIIFEPLYEWLAEKKEEHDDKRKKQKISEQGECDPCGGSGETEDGEECSDCKGSGKDQEKDSQGNDSYGNYGKSGDEEVDTYSLDSIFDNLDQTGGEYMDSHIEDTIPEELRDSIVKEAYEKLKARGLTKGNVESTVNKLRKKKKDHLKQIKRSVSNIIGSGSKNKTIVRPNRRGIKGLKGSRKLKSKINCILDTSGSMAGLFEKTLSYIYRNDIEVNLIEADTEVRWVENIKNKKKLDTLKIKGLGGTILQPSIDYVTENYNQYNTVILTDGYCDSLDLSEIKGSVLIISAGKEVPIKVVNKRNRLKQIIIEE
jgi:predicted metal-dependent peptidase